MSADQRSDRDTASRVLGGAHWVKPTALAGERFDIIWSELSTNGFNEPEQRFTLRLVPHPGSQLAEMPTVMVGLDPTPMRARILEHFQRGGLALGPCVLEKREPDGVWTFRLVD